MSLLSKEEIGWLAGARDAQVGKVLALMHRKTATRWTLSSLANEAGTSRAVLAQRFRQYLGEPPLSYLTRWRLQLAAQMLSSTSYNVAQIASKVGYDSEQAFNRYFRRSFGDPPARYRKARREETAKAPYGRLTDGWICFSIMGRCFLSQTSGANRGTARSKTT